MMKKLTLYNKSVFVNFPFDPPASEYRNLFDALIFSIIECGFEPRCALERSDSGESRIEKIMELIKDCQYGIHDISCINIDGNGFPRFNMPFELGLFFGAKRYGISQQKKKSCLIFEKSEHEYDKYLSDISGNDPKCHHMRVEEIIRHTRNWLNEKIKKTIPEGNEITKRYKIFLGELPYICNKLKLNPQNLEFTDYHKISSYWVKNVKVP